MKRADFFTVDDPSKNTVKCSLCNHYCLIKDGKRGICGVRENQQGILYSLVYGKIVSENIDPIEKKPLFHVLPTTQSFSIATVGCNFRCQHCQNYEISQYPRLFDGNIAGRDRTPEQIVAAAQQQNCSSISYTYIEPTMFFEFACETAQLAHEQGLLNVFVSNGYTSPEATRKIAPLLDANNIDLKAFTDKFYKEVCGARLQPVLDTIALMKELGVWVEVTTLVIPGWNDSNEELEKIAKFLVSIDPQIPWHVTKFHPTFKMTDRPPTPVDSLRRARDIGFEAGLQYVYTGNIPGEQGENTYCPKCRQTVIERTGFYAQKSGLSGNTCKNCQHEIAGIFTGPQRLP